MQSSFLIMWVQNVKIFMQSIACKYSLFLGYILSPYIYNEYFCISKLTEESKVV